MPRQESSIKSHTRHLPSILFRFVPSCIHGRENAGHRQRPSVPIGSTEKEEEEDKDSLIVLQEPLHALLHSLLERRELEPSGRLHQAHQLLVRRRLSELTVRFGGVKLPYSNEEGNIGQVDELYGR
jgi:hypothetical protein